jgi:hypothetical protein
MIIRGRLAALLLAGCLAAGGCTAPVVPAPDAPVSLADLETRVGCVDDRSDAAGPLPVQSATCDFDGVPVTFATFRDIDDREHWIAGEAGHVAAGTGWALSCPDRLTAAKLALILDGVSRDA